MTDIEKTLDDLKLMNALCHGTVLDDAIALLTGQPQVVRCKDCIYMEKMDVDIGEGDLIWCSVHEFGREIDYYCADGERR